MYICTQIDYLSLCLFPYVEQSGICYRGVIRFCYSAPNAEARCARAHKLCDVRFRNASIHRDENSGMTRMKFRNTSRCARVVRNALLADSRDRHEMNYIADRGESIEYFKRCMHKHPKPDF